MLHQFKPELHNFFRLCRDQFQRVRHRRIVRSFRSPLFLRSKPGPGSNNSAPVSAGAISGRIQIPGRTFRSLIPAATARMSGNRAASRQPSSTTVNGRTASPDESSAISSASRSVSFAEFFP